MAGEHTELLRKSGNFHVDGFLSACPMMLSAGTGVGFHTGHSVRSHMFAVGKTLSSVEGSRSKKQPNENIDLWFLVSGF